MPGAAHGIPNHEALRQRAMVVRTKAPHRENIHAAPDQQNIIFADMTENLASIRDLVLRNSKSSDQGRSARVGQPCSLSSHGPDLRSNSGVTASKTLPLCRGRDASLSEPPGFAAPGPNSRRHQLTAVHGRGRRPPNVF